MLPNDFRPTGTFDLLRLGKDFDGGYLVERGSLARSRTLFSFGLADDWSFEMDFVKHTQARVEAFDHTISLWRFRRRLARAVFRPYKLAALRRAYTAATSYPRFFSQEARHHRIKIGFPGPRSKSIREVVGAETAVFLKVDIEGWEYRVLDDLVELAGQIEGVVIEFHDVDLHRERICAFIRQFPLNLCHIHVNNYGGVDPAGDPLAVEMTFSKYPPLTTAPAAFPHALDMANNPAVPDVYPTFAADFPADYPAEFAADPAAAAT